MRMRTTLTIDQDVLDTARKVPRQLNTPFRHVVNEALRIGLREVEKPALAKPYRTVPHDMGLRGGFSLNNIQEVLAQTDSKAITRRTKE